MLVPRAALLLLICWVPLAAAQTGPWYGEEVEDLREVRREHLEYWRELEANRVEGLERFARTVQRAVAARAETHTDDARAAALLALDDLVDLFVDDSFWLEKGLLMSTPAVLSGATPDEDLTGFAPRFQAGEGRYRHFVLSAAAAYAAPESLVDLLARLRGGDVVPSSADSEADLATNAVGRAFAELLRTRPFSELAQGQMVFDWLMDRFGE